MKSQFGKYLLFVILVNTLIFVNAQWDCQDWQAFKTNKCYKIIKNKLTDFNSAKKVCNDLKNSTLLVIENAEQQDFLNKFIFETNNLVENVWIGLLKNKTTGQFEWVDNTPLVYQKWGKDNPKNKIGKDCVHMNSEDGTWNNFNCSKVNAIVCQRMPVMTMDAMYKLMLQMETKLKVFEGKQQNFQNEQNNLQNNQQKTVKELKELKQYQDNFSSFPIGFIFVQFPSQSEPKLLFPNTEWSDISSQYAGYFFRTLGGSSADFGQVQEDASPRITDVLTQFFTNGHSETMKVFDENPNGTNRWTVRDKDKNYHGIYTGTERSTTTTDTRHIIFKLSLAEVRPKNMAVKIWKRVK